MKSIFALSALVCLVSAMPASAQLYLENPSFEGNGTPPGWEACGNVGNFNTGASNGTNYVQVGTSDLFGDGNNTDINIAQKLVCPMTPGSNVSFTIDLKTADTTDFTYDNSAFLEVHCGSDPCTPTTLLWSSPRINHYNWQTYTVNFTAPSACPYLIFKVRCVGCNGNFFGGGGGRVQMDNIVSPGTICAPTVTLDSNLVCAGECLDLIPAVIGGQPPLTYAWSDGLGSGTSANVCPAGDGSYSVTVTDSLGRSSSATGFVTIDTDPFCGQSLECHKQDCAAPYGTYFVNPSNTNVTFQQAMQNGWCYTIDESQLPAILCFAFKASDPNAPFEQFNLHISYQNCPPGGSGVNGGFSVGSQSVSVTSTSVGGNSTGGSTSSSGGCFQIENYVDIGSNGVREAEHEGTFHYPGCTKVANNFVAGRTCNLLIPGEIYTHCYDLKPSGCGTVMICPIYNCGNGCIPDPPCLQIENVVRTTDVTCFGANDGTALALVCEDSLFTYVWSTGATTRTITGLAPSAYTVTITEIESGCDTTRSIAITEPPQILADAGPMKELCANETFVMGGAPTATGGMGGFTYIWTPPVNLDDPNSPNPTVGGLTETVTYTLVVTDSTGCSDSSEVTIVGRPCDITIPNVFTPNGEGPNNNFIIKGIEYFPGSRLIIFNRWGEKVWESMSYHNEWDGRHWKSLNRLNEGVYYWILYLNDPYTANLDETNTRHGWVHLIRNNEDIN